MQNKNILYIATVALLTLFSHKLIAQVYEQKPKSEISNSILIRESIQLNTDKDLYIAGDNMFFKLYLKNSSALNYFQMSDYVYLVLRSERAIIVKSMVKIKDGNSFGSINLSDTLKSGVYQLLAYTNYMRNFDEESYFQKSILVVNRFDNTLSNLYSKDSSFQNEQLVKDNSQNTNSKESYLKVELEKDSFKVREKIKIKLKINNSFINHPKADVSISVKELNPLIDPITNTSILISHNCIAEDSVGLKNSKKTSFQSFLPEKKGIYMRGKININDEPFKHEYIYVSTPDTCSNLQYAITDDKGDFQFLLNNYYLGKNLVLKLKNNQYGYQNSEIILDDKYNLKSRFVPVLPLLTIDLKKYIYKCQDILQVQKSYNSKKVLNKPNNTNEKISFPYVYRTPFSVIFPSKYVPLENFKEIVSNLMVGVKIVKEKTENEIYIASRLNQVYYNIQPALFLDGVPIDNINQIINFASEDIQRIELCRILKIKGDLNYAGILSIFSNKKRVNSLPFNKPYIKFKIEPVIDMAYYETPNYENLVNQENVPDFRQLLYWNPNVQLSANEEFEFEFYASDYLTEYIIEIQGVANDELPISEFTKIKIYR